jgi:nitrate reductase alpha subunit
MTNRIFVFKVPEGCQLTDNWHDGGAAVVIAPDFNTAARALEEWCATEHKHDGWITKEATTLKWYHCESEKWQKRISVTRLAGTTTCPSDVFVFRDAGCC